MEQIGFDYVVNARVRLDGHEIHRLGKLAMRHYDSKCRASAMLGGFLYGIAIQWLMQIDEKLEDSHYAFALFDSAPDITLDRVEEFVVTPYQLGILGKIGENEEFNAEGDITYGFTWLCTQMIKKCSAKYEELTNA